MIIRQIAIDANAGMQDIEACVQMQKDVGWGEEAVPAHVLRADSIGVIDPVIGLGFVLIATEEQETVVGFARVTHTRDAAKFWLHEIVVRPDRQSTGTGYKLMGAVRQHIISLSGEELLFTYDPFEGANGNLYLNKCGAQAIRVYPNLYGMIQSHAHGNRETHRFLMSIDLTSLPRLLMPGLHDFDSAPIISKLPIPTEIPKIRVEIPFRVQDLHPHEASLWQAAAFPLLVQAINVAGYRGTYLDSRPDKRRNFIVLEKHRDPIRN